MADFTGATVKVTLKQPAGTILHGRVREVAAGTLALEDVFFPNTGARWAQWTVQGAAIADLQVIGKEEEQKAPVQQQMPSMPQQHQQQMPPMQQQMHMQRPMHPAQMPMPMHMQQHQHAGFAPPPMPMHMHQGPPPVPMHMQRPPSACIGSTTSQPNPTSIPDSAKHAYATEAACNLC
jgi:enhancer of mRNA-decapping protein 3